MSDEPMAYVGKCRNCGGIYMATVDMPERAEDVARDVAEVLAAGDTVERVTVEWVRQNWAACKCDNAPTTADTLAQRELAGEVFVCRAPASPEVSRRAELARLEAWNAGKPRKVTA